MDAITDAEIRLGEIARSHGGEGKRLTPAIPSADLPKGPRGWKADINTLRLSTMKIVAQVELPSREEILSRLRALRSGTLSREDASAWAEHFITADERGYDPKVPDWAAWEALKCLMGADLNGGDRAYLYRDADFDEWTRRLASAP